MENINKFKQRYMVLNETEKAIKVAFVIVRKFNGEPVALYQVARWVPKSQITEDGDFKDWLFEKIVDELFIELTKSFMNGATIMPDPDGKFILNGEEWQYTGKFFTKLSNRS